MLEKTQQQAEVGKKLSEKQKLEKTSQVEEAGRIQLMRASLNDATAISGSV
jgi:hypothetical protein